MFADVSSSSRATCPNTEMRRRDRRCDSEVRSPSKYKKMVKAGEGVSTFFDASSLAHFFGLKFVQKLGHCCN